MSGPVSGATRRPVALPTNADVGVNNQGTQAQAPGGGAGNIARPGQRPTAGDGFERARTGFIAGLGTRQPAATNVMRQGMPSDATIAQTFSQPLIPANRFLSELGSTPAQREVLGALVKDPRFEGLWSYFEKFPGGNPLRFASVPGLKMTGKERFGGYFPGMGLLAINPTKPEHVNNPQELSDTIIHELAHAALDVHQRAQANGIKPPPWPLPQGATDLPHDPHFGSRSRSTRIDSAGMAPEREYMDRNYGPGASNPKEEWIDINHGTQQFIVGIIKDSIRQTGHGAPTITFDNLK